jgi:hypothetical protein
VKGKERERESLKRKNDSHVTVITIIESINLTNSKYDKRGENRNFFICSNSICAQYLFRSLS